VVSGPTVAFQVAEPNKRKFPWWIVIVAVVAVLLLAGGGILIWLLTRPAPPPTLIKAPTISGTVQIGSDLTVVDGGWDPADAVLFHVWQSCPATATDEDAVDCVNITVGTGPDAKVAQGQSYVVSPADEGRRIRVVETAVRVDPKATGKDAPKDVSVLPHESAASKMTDTVPPAPPTTAPVPAVVGLTFGDAQSVLSQAGFQILGTTSSETGECDPPIEDQNPEAGVEANIGSVVAVTTKQPPPITACWNFPLNDHLLIPNDWIFEQVGP
ncbi:PASTA domain-containing protein, partial [Microbacterium deminutum]|uniref:PASTA domain-containing protein n=1 Tax=Microbacterium deminutum TaxID=344164 RepID=UPI0031D71877